MAKEFTDLPATFCFPKCPNMSLSVDTRFMYADDKLYTASASVICAHEDACKMWAKQVRDIICSSCTNKEFCERHPSLITRCTRQPDIHKEENNG